MASQVNRYRYYCQTESNFVYKWDTTKPVTCINNIAHTIDSNSISIIDTVANNDVSVDNLSLTCFEEVRTAEKTTIFDVKSMFGRSVLRDSYITSNTASISNIVGASEYTIQATGANDYAAIQTLERGKYIAGIMAEVGMGVRIPQIMTSNQFVKFGLFDNSNGLYFVYNSTGIGVARLRNGVETITINSNLNLDKLDGTGPSQIVYDASKGYIYNIRFSWYGYGIIEYGISTQSIAGNQRELLLHREMVANQTSINSPNLPIRLVVANNGTAGSNLAYMSGRQYSLMGKYEPIFRPGGTYVSNISINSTSVFTPVMSVRRKTAYAGVPIRIRSADIVTSTQQLIQVRVGGTLTGAVWGNVQDQDPKETGIEVDTTATVITGGYVLWVGYMDPNRNTLRAIDNIDEFNLQEQLPVTICARTTGNAGTVSVAFRWVEEW